MNNLTLSDYVVQATSLKKVYLMGEFEVHALCGVDINIKHSEVVSIMGPSGSGKSTLMNMLGCLDRPSEGEYWLEGEAVSNFTDDQLSSIRNRKVGFIFQQFNLLPRQTAVSNVILPLRYAGWNGQKAQDKARAALEMVGLSDREKHKPNELSGGQQQRVAIARALVNDPAIILADEPTGALDSKTGQEIMELLLKMNQDYGTTLIFVTHDSRIASMTQRTIHIKDGLIDKESK